MKRCSLITVASLFFSSMSIADVVNLDCSFESGNFRYHDCAKNSKDYRCQLKVDIDVDQKSVFELHSKHETAIETFPAEFSPSSVFWSNHHLHIPTNIPSWEYDKYDLTHDHSKQLVPYYETKVKYFLNRETLAIHMDWEEKNVIKGGEFKAGHREGMCKIVERNRANKF
jgi:hypothetical protein